VRQYTEFALLLRKDKCVSKRHSESHMCIHGWRLAVSEGLEHRNLLRYACLWCLFMACSNWVQIFRTKYT